MFPRFIAFRRVRIFSVMSPISRLTPSFLCCSLPSSVSWTAAACPCRAAKAAKAAPAARDALGQSRPEPSPPSTTPKLTDGRTTRTFDGGGCSETIDLSLLTAGRDDDHIPGNAVKAAEGEDAVGDVTELPNDPLSSTPNTVSSDDRSRTARILPMVPLEVAPTEDALTSTAALVFAEVAETLVLGEPLEKTVFPSLCSSSASNLFFVEDVNSATLGCSTPATFRSAPIFGSPPPFCSTPAFGSFSACCSRFCCCSCAFCNIRRWLVSCSCTSTTCACASISVCLYLLVASSNSSIVLGALYFLSKLWHSF
mmetsp:Transcript_1678/g.4543  ORF Transcript_1678/g.4543 Transcript_1678/m.4543 type:complete len:311 (+) Transcript_1678:928-1860(+)